MQVRHAILFDPWLAAIATVTIHVLFTAVSSRISHFGSCTHLELKIIITGPPDGPVLLCSLASVIWLSSSSSVTLPAGGPAAGHVGGRPPPAGRVGDRAVDTARRASMVTSH